MGKPGQAFLTSFVPLVILAMLQTGLPVLAPALMQASGMQPAAFGWIGGAMGLGSVWLYMANAAFTTALGPVRACQISALISVAGVVLVLTGHYFLMLPGAVLIGFGYATMTPAGTQILADHTPRATRSTLFSLRQAGVPLGGALAGSLGSWITVQYGWRAALGGLALICLALAPALALAPRIFNEARPRSHFRLGRLFRVSNLGEPFRTVRATPGLARIAAACIGFAVVQGTVNSFFVIYATTSLGLSLTFAGTLYAIMQTSSVAGRIVLGFVADWLGSARLVMRALAGLSALAALLLASLGSDWSTPQLVGAMILAGLSVATWNGLYLAEIATMAPETVSEATAGATFFVFATYMVTPPLMGLVIVNFGYRPAFMIAAAAVALAGVILSVPWLSAPWDRARP